jgi:putative membrane-bound dehydrogenase-like protein
MRILIFGFGLLLLLTPRASGQDEARREPPAGLLKTAALPERAKGTGARFIDLNGDGYEDIVVSNDQGYGVYLFVPKEKEKKNLQWFEGWTLVMREGKAGDANSLPIIREGSVWFAEGALWSRSEGDKNGAMKIPFSELLRVPGPAPLSPGDSLRALHLKAGFEAKLVAHEPLVEDPVYIDWDEHGRMWVVEMGDYPFAPGEKTTNGKTGQGKVSARQTGRIKILEDKDGDGIYEKATLFLDGLTHPTSVTPWKGGVFVASIPDIFYAEDTDGDGKCDTREVWFTGFTAGNPQHLVNGFAWGLEGWFYGANGDSGGEIKCLKSGQKMALGTHDFRFHPETGELALEAGRSQFGRWRDDYGNWFGNNNSILGWHYWLPIRFLEEHPEISAKSLRASLNDEKRVFPVSPPVRRFNWASATQTLTSACAPMPYRDTALGAAMTDTLLICEPANNLVHRQVLDYSQTPIKSRRHVEDATSEFIASEDNWFRPTQARMGPDGALYVVDMYRLVLEHPEWIPAEIATGLDLRAGEDKGRIYRISKPDASVRVSFADPISQMSSSNGWVRDTAQRLLIERDSKEAAPAMLALAASDAPIAVRIQALFTAKALGGITSDQLLNLLLPLKPQVRGAALLSTGAKAKDILPENELTYLKAQAQPDKKGEAAAVPVITHNNPDRQKIVGRYNTELPRLKADSSRGQAVFQKACMACHKTRGIGVEVGPDLSTVASKPDEQLIEAIFDPNRAVEQRNATTQVTQKDGAMILGLLVTETPHSITLRMPGGADVVVQRASIRELKTLNTSLMLVGLESVITPQECADLLAWIRTGR